MTNAYAKAACLGVIAGIRSMSAPAMTSTHLVVAQPDDLTDSPLDWMTSPTTAGVFRTLAAGEVLADKLPFLPARTDPLPLFGRAMTGALSGAAVCVAGGEGMIEGAIVGAVSAVASAHLFYQLRRRLGQATRLPDPVIAVAEDGLMLGLGHLALAE